MAETRHRALWLLPALLLAVLCLTAPGAGAEDAAPDADGPTVVRVGYVLFENYQEGGEGEYKRGFGYEYLQRVAYATGWEYEYVYGSFSELFAMLQRGEIDLMGDISYTEERAKTISYSALPQGREKYYIYTTADQQRIDPYDTATLNGCRVAVTANSYQYGLLLDWLQENDCSVAVMEYTGSAQAAEALRSGEADAMIMTDMASASGYVPVVSIGFAEFFFGVNRARPDLLAELNAALREIQTIDPYYNEVTYARYNTSSLSNRYLSRRERLWLTGHDNTVRLGYLADNLPYSDVDENGAPRGLITVVIRTLEEEVCIRVEPVAFRLPKEMVEAAKADRVDLFGPLYGDFWLAEQYGIFNTNPITDTTCLLLYQGEYDDSVTDRISLFSGNAIQKGALEVLFPEAETVYCDSREDSLEAVLDGRAGCTIVSAATLNLLRQYPAMDSLNFLELPSAADICLGTVRGSAELLNIVNRAIFASSEDLTGAALMVNVHADAPFSLREYLQQHAIMVILLLLGIIVLLIGAFAYYLNVNLRLLRMEHKNQELSRQAYRDGLTRVGNRAGYLAKEKELQLSMVLGEAPDFALVVADVNGLKQINDTEGHEVGDKLICNTSRLICRIYDHSPVFRIGGDEFAVVLTGQDYENRDRLLALLRDSVLPRVDRAQVEAGHTSAACGMAVFERGRDQTVAAIFKRADREMYRCKKTGR